MQFCHHSLISIMSSSDQCMRRRPWPYMGLVNTVSLLKLFLFSHIAFFLDESLAESRLEANLKIRIKFLHIRVRIKFLHISRSVDFRS